MRLKQKLTIGACVITLALPATGAPLKTIKIGVSGAYSGPSASLGNSMRDGVKLAADEINANGGLLGRRIELIERDDQSRDDIGIKIAQELSNTLKVAAVVGFTDSNVASSSQRVYQEATIPVINNVASSALITRQFAPPIHSDNYIFSTAANDINQAALIAKDLKKRKLTRAALLIISSQTQQLNQASMEAALNQKGIKPIIFASLNSDRPNATEYLLRAKDMGAQVLIGLGSSVHLGQIVANLETLKWKVPVIGGANLECDTFISNAGTQAAGTRMPVTFFENTAQAKGQAFVNAYFRKYKTKYLPCPSAAAQGYDSLHLLAAAIRQAESTDGRKIKHALENLNNPVEGVITTYKRPFTVRNHEALSLRNLFMGEIRQKKIVAVP